MSRKFTVTPDYYDEGDIIFKKKSFQINPGVTILVGCNGSGKTTLLNVIKRSIENKGLPLIYYNNLTDGGSQSRSKAAFLGDFGFLATSLYSSEGENIRLNLTNIVKRIGKCVSDNKDAKEFWFILDAIDSGFSVDNVIEIKKDLLSFVLEEEKDKDIYFVISANEYELCKDYDCLDVTNLKYVKFPDYDSYRDFIIESREYKNKRYEKGG